MPAAASAFSPDREELIDAAEAVKLHVAHWAPKTAPRVNVVAIHGFTVYCGPYGEFFRRLTEAGIAVTAFDCRGHGRSGGRRGHVPRFGLFLEDLELVVAAARKLHPELPLALLGHSLGATIALDAALAAKIAPDRLVLATPFLDRAMKVAGWKLAFSGLASRFWPTFAADNEIKPEDGSRNPLVVEYFFKDPLIHHVASARWFTETCAAQERIKATGARLCVPTLLITAGQDRVVAIPPIEALAAGAPEFIQTKHYPALFHELFLEPEWEEVAADIIQWLTSPISNRPDARTEAAPTSVPAILQPPP